MTPPGGNDGRIAGNEKENFSQCEGLHRGGEIEKKKKIGGKGGGILISKLAVERKVAFSGQAKRGDERLEIRKSLITCCCEKRSLF